MNSAANSQGTAASRSRAALPSDYRRVLEASNLPIEQAVAIADMVELALRSDITATEQEPCAWRWKDKFEDLHGSGPWRYQQHAPMDTDAVKIEPLYPLPWAPTPNRSDESVRVPREPTQEIRFAICDMMFGEWRNEELHLQAKCLDEADEIYRAILAAAPKSLPQEQIASLNHKAGEIPQVVALQDQPAAAAPNAELVRRLWRIIVSNENAPAVYALLNEAAAALSRQPAGAKVGEKALRSESASPCVDMAGNAYVQSRATTSPYDLAGQKEYPGE